MTDAERLLEAVEKKSEPHLRAIRKRIEDGTATFADTAEYSRILSELLGRELSAEVLGLTDREGTAEALLRESYNDTNEVCAQVQTALDEKKGLHPASQKAPFPAERVAQFVHSLVDPTVPDEKIQRRAKSGTENISMSFHDDFIEQNAEFRERAGLKCYVTRTSSGSCCPWCTAVAGKYLMSEQPEGLFRRHDNCDCVIVYDGQVLRGQKGENGRRNKKWVEDKAARIEFAESVPKPVVNSPEQAAELEMVYMSKSFRPEYSNKNSDITVGNISISTKKVENSKFNLLTDVENSKRNKAVRLAEKNLTKVQSHLSESFTFPTVAVVDFEKHGLNSDAIGGYYAQGDILFLNSRYDTTGKILQYVNEQQGQFANKTELAPILHELGHKFYEDSVKALAKSQNLEYNIAKSKIDEKIFDFVHSRNENGRFVIDNISRYADKGFLQHSYTEIAAECFSVSETNSVAKEIIKLLRGDFYDD